jgi:hypothetical protein
MLSVTQFSSTGHGISSINPVVIKRNAAVLYFNLRILADLLSDSITYHRDWLRSWHSVIIESLSDTCAVFNVLLYFCTFRWCHVSMLQLQFDIDELHSIQQQTNGHRSRQD